MHSFIVKDCVHQNFAALKDARIEEVGGLDTERQDLISLSEMDLLIAVKSGSFREVQWSNTVALAMLNANNNFR